MDPTHKKHPKSTTKPHPDPTIASSTIHTISNQFSKLYANHKALSSLKPSNPPSSQPRIDTHLQARSLTRSAIEDSSAKWLSKSSPQQLSRTMVDMGKQGNRAKPRRVKEKPKSSHEEEINKLPQKESKKRETHEGIDIKRSALALSRSQEGECKNSHDKRKPSLTLAVGGGGGGGGRRRSFCNSKSELADFFTCSGVKVVAVDMPPFMQVHAVDCARKALDSLEKFTSKTLALTLKKEFDGVYGPAWHCIVGTSFGSFVTHSVGGFLYFSMDHKIYVLLFKTTVQRAD